MNAHGTQTAKRAKYAKALSKKVKLENQQIQNITMQIERSMK